MRGKHTCVTKFQLHLMLWVNAMDRMTEANTLQETKLLRNMKRYTRKMSLSNYQDCPGTYLFSKLHFGLTRRFPDITPSPSLDCTDIPGSAYFCLRFLDFGLLDASARKERRTNNTNYTIQYNHSVPKEGQLICSRPNCKYAQNTNKTHQPYHNTETKASYITCQNAK